MAWASEKERRKIRRFKSVDIYINALEKRDTELAQFAKMIRLIGCLGCSMGTYYAHQLRDLADYINEHIEDYTWV